MGDDAPRWHARDPDVADELEDQGRPDPYGPNSRELREEVRGLYLSLTGRRRGGAAPERVPRA